MSKKRPIQNHAALSQEFQMPEIECACHLPLIQKARQMLDTLLFEADVPIQKAFDFKHPEGFDQAVMTVSKMLRGNAEQAEKEALREVLSILNKKRFTISTGPEKHVIQEAAQKARKSFHSMLPKIRDTLREALEELVQAAKATAVNPTRVRKSFHVNTVKQFNAFDRRVTEFITRSQLGFVTREYDRRLEHFEDEVRHTISEGLESGLGREELSQNLNHIARHALSSRSSVYWEIVAGSVVSTARSYGQMSAFTEAGIERYRIEAVLDEHTTEVCRFLHGKVFETGAAMKRFESMTQMDSSETTRDLSALKEAHPWIREAVDRETGKKMLFVWQGKKKIPLLEVMRSGMERRDDVGEHRAAVSHQSLTDLGVSFPPFHALCRSTVQGLV